MSSCEESTGSCVTYVKRSFIRIVIYRILMLHAKMLFTRYYFAS